MSRRQHSNCSFNFIVKCNYEYIITRILHYYISCSNFEFAKTYHIIRNDDPAPQKNSEWPGLTRHSSSLRSGWQPPIIYGGNFVGE